MQHVETVADANNWSVETMRRSIVVNLPGAATSVVAGLEMISGATSAPSSTP